MDAVDRRIEQEIQSARLSILREADPENGPKCPHCGEPTLSGAWRTAYDLKAAARNQESAGCMGLAMRRLVDEGMFVQNKELRLRLSTKGRRAAAKLR
jgi:hypothetical protein